MNFILFKFYFSVIIFISINNNVLAIQDYCSLNTYASNATYMQFTKEPSVEEFAIIGKFKGLHCCAKGYRSIEWYKDGKPYPWPLTQSQLILYPESANQTVYTKRVTEVDAGNYTCLLRNDTVVHSHTIQLIVFEKIPDDPKITYISPDKEVPIGHSLRLFCEAFAGRVDLPDAHNEAVWRKVGHNGTIENESRIRQEKISREDEQTFGTYLIIEKIKEEDFGEYICKISKPGKSIEHVVYIREKVEVKYLNPNPVPVGKLLLVMSAIFFLLLVAVILNLQYGLSLRVQFKDSFGTLEMQDGKTSDILILHSSKDDDLILGYLIPTLQNKYDYNCKCKEIIPNITYWFSHLHEEIKNSRRTIVVLSPAVFNDNWNSTIIYQALKQLESLDPKMCIITLKEFPYNKNEIKNSQGETLKSLLRILNIIYWERSKDEKFWLALRLRLPPKRGYNMLGNRNMTHHGENSSRLTSDSDDGTDNCV